MHAFNRVTVMNALKFFHLDTMFENGVHIHAPERFQLVLNQAATALAQHTFGIAPSDLELGRAKTCIANAL